MLRMAFELYNTDQLLNSSRGSFLNPTCSVVEESRTATLNHTNRINRCSNTTKNQIIMIGEYWL